ncbi:MAG TPA: hypothetical protein VD866_31890, partial [Urbifossiella sp.]|nr:hypothetical protein [Urbifossiella sp.]
AGLTMAGDVFGTPGYMPPEQARGEWDTVDARADVFALGSILVVLLTGQPAYTGETTEEVLRRSIAGEHAELLERIDRTVRYDRDYDRSRVALDCLATDPGRRPPTATALLQRIRSDAAKAVRRRKDHHRSLFLVASAAVLAFLGLVAAACAFAAERVYRTTTEDASREVDGTLTRTAWYGKGAVERVLHDHVAFVEEHARVTPEVRRRLTAAADAAAAAGGDAARAHDLVPDRAAFDALVARVHGDAQERWPAVEGRTVSLLVVTGDTPAGGPARGFTLAREKAGVPAAADRADPAQARNYRTDWSFYDYFAAGGNRFDEQDRPHPVVRHTHISQTYQLRGDGGWRLDVVTPVWAADGRAVGLLSVGLDVNRHLRNLIDMPDHLLADRQEIAKALHAFVVNDRGALVWHKGGMAAVDADAARDVHRDPENLTDLARRLAPAHGRHPDDLVPWKSVDHGLEDGPDRYVDPVVLGAGGDGADLLAHTLTFRPFAHSRYAENRGRVWGFVAQVPEAMSLASVERLKGQLVWAAVTFVLVAGGLVFVVWLWLFRVVGK